MPNASFTHATKEATLGGVTLADAVAFAVADAVAVVRWGGGGTVAAALADAVIATVAGVVLSVGSLRSGAPQLTNDAASQSGG